MVLGGFGWFRVLETTHLDMPHLHGDSNISMPCNFC